MSNLKVVSDGGRTKARVDDDSVVEGDNSRLGSASFEDLSAGSAPLAEVLIVDDEVNSLTGLAELVSREGFSTSTATTLAEARACISRRRPDLVLLDLTLPDGDGLELLEVLEAASLDGSLPDVVVITGNARVETSVNALEKGVSDYLIKPIQIPQLRRILSHLTQPSALKGEVINLRAELRKLGRFGRLMGSSTAMQMVYDQVARVAPTSATVLLTGESGTGKEVVATTIHELSRRRKQSFLPINCGAISPQLIESELFGHEKGSFTGAVRDHRGYFERAHGGTLFLDEITEMPIELQVKLLRVLETRFFTRVGSDREIETDVRIIAATNRPPEEAVKRGYLREDLLYRLQVFPIHLPPIRERGEDIGLLANFFLDELNESEGTVKRFSASALDALSKHHWPGNLRELRNVVYRSFIMANSVIEESNFPKEITAPRQAMGSCFTVRVGTSVAEVERNLIMATLDQCEGKKEKAAEILGVSVKTLYNRLKDYEES